MNRGAITKGGGGHTPPFPFSPEERGGIVLLPVIALALLAAVGYALSSGGTLSASHAAVDEISSDLLTQGALVRGRLNQCVLTYPGGGWPSSGQVAGLDCPGAPGATAAERNLWTGQWSFAALPPAPKGYQEWQYVNDASGIRLTLTPEVGRADDPALKSAAAEFQARHRTGVVTVDSSTGTITYWLKQ